MIILALRTDKPEAEAGIYIDGKQVGYITWLADRQLTKTIHKQIQEMLNKLSIDWNEISGIVVYEGPGSFTGLRIGISVTNALAFANQVPIVASGGSNWIESGLKKIDSGESDKLAVPKYGRPANITKPRK